MKIYNGQFLNSFLQDKVAADEWSQDIFDRVASLTDVSVSHFYL